MALRVRKSNFLKIPLEVFLEETRHASRYNKDFDFP